MQMEFKRYLKCMCHQIKAFFCKKLRRNETATPYTLQSHNKDEDCALLRVTFFERCMQLLNYVNAYIAVSIVAFLPFCVSVALIFLPRCASCALFQGVPTVFDI